MQKFKNNTEVLSNDVFKLHQLSQAEDIPTLILPPFAGRSGNIVQNMADALVAEGHTVFAYELLSASHSTRNTSVSDLIDIISTCQEHMGAKQINLVGTCQGGWLATIYTALYPDRVKKLAIFAAPINIKTSYPNKIEEYCETASIEDHTKMVELNGGIQSGMAQWMAFALSSPYEVFIGKYMQLFRLNIQGDTKKIKKWYDNDTWYNDTQNLAGVWFLDVLENHFMHNKLYDGTWEVKGRKVNLASITCPVYVYSGESDEITHPEQARAILDKVSSAETYYKCFPEAGHTRVFVGTAELNYFTAEFIDRVIYSQCPH